MYIWFNKFSPDNVILGKTNTIVPLLVKMFPNEQKYFESINSEFRALADLQYLKSLTDEKICIFWDKVSKLKKLIR